VLLLWNFWKYAIQGGVLESLKKKMLPIALLRELQIFFV